MKPDHVFLVSFGLAVLFSTQMESCHAASIKAKEPSSPEVTDAWTIPKQRRGRERRSIIFPEEESDEYALYDEEYENLVSNKVRELWYGKAPTIPTSTTTESSAIPINTTTRKNWYPDLPIAWGRMLDNP